MTTSMVLVNSINENKEFIMGFFCGIFTIFIVYFIVFLRGAFGDLNDK